MNVYAGWPTMWYAMSYDPVPPVEMATVEVPPWSSVILFLFHATLNEVFHVKSSVTTGFAPIVASIPIFSIVPMLSHIMLAVFIAPVGTYERRSVVLRRYQSAARVMRLLRKPMSIPTFHVVVVSHFRLGL